MFSGKPDVEDSVESSVDEAKQQFSEEGVTVERSRGSIERKLERLEELVIGLRERQKQLEEVGSDQMHEVEFGEAVEVSELDQKIDEAMDSGVDLSRVEQRLDTLEMALERVESINRSHMEDFKDEIIEEASDLHTGKLKELEDRLNELSTDEQGLKKEVFEDLSSVEGRMDDIQESIDSIEGRMDAQESDVQEEINAVRKEKQSEITDIQEQLEELRKMIFSSNLEEKVDSDELESRLNEMQDGLQSRIDERAQALREEIEEQGPDERVVERLEELESRLSGDVEERLDSLDDRISDVDHAILGDLEDRIEELEEEKDGKVDQEEFENLKSDMEELSDLLVRVAQN